MSLEDVLLHGEWILRIVVASICGCLIGYERSNRNKEAGLRTHSIVSLGSALIMIVSKYGFNDIGGADGARVAAQIVSGIGFLGAGIIYVKNGTVLGLTTAAGVWATSGVGMSIGAGLYDIGIIATISILAIQTVLHKEFVSKRLQNSLSVYLEIRPEPGALSDVYETFKTNEITIFDFRTEKIRDETILLEIECNVRSNFSKQDFSEIMVQKPYFKRISIS